MQPRQQLPSLARFHRQHLHQRCRHPLTGRSLQGRQCRFRLILYLTGHRHQTDYLVHFDQAHHRQLQTSHHCHRLAPTCRLQGRRRFLVRHLGFLLNLR